MKAVHFGAGNIGRGFIGLILKQAGYDLTFADVNADLIDNLNSAKAYQVHEVGLAARTYTVDIASAINSSTQGELLADEIGAADVVTCAVGPSILKFIAPSILAGLQKRTRPEPLVVMACENAVNATDQLREAIESLAGESWPAISERAIFANTAVDRIVPVQAPDAGLDVTVEDFCEWTIESGPFGGAVPPIAEAHFVPDLEPYIERKLFTVNTGHATTAYFGFNDGIEVISDAISNPNVYSHVESVLLETSALLVQKHGFAAAEQTAYRNRILERFANAELPDTVERVGRAPLRKLSRHERFIAPAVECAQRGLPYRALLNAISAALRFDVAEDEESQELQKRLAMLSPDEFVGTVCGIAAGELLFEELTSLVVARQLELRSL